MNNNFPCRTEVAIKMDKLFKVPEKKLLSERMSSRIVKCASVLSEGEYIGWQMIMPVKGLSTISLFGTGGVSPDDLEWIAEKTGKLEKCKLSSEIDPALKELYEFYLPVAECQGGGSTIGFAAGDPPKENEETMWPAHYSSQFAELFRVFRIAGAAMRVVVAPAGEQEQADCRKRTLRTYDIHNIDATEYIGSPVKIRVLVRMPSAPSLRLKAVLKDAIRGMKIRYIGKLTDKAVAKVWDDPANGAVCLPDLAARILMLEPELQEPIVGIQICEEAMKKIPASHSGTKQKKAVVIGKAEDTSGIMRKISIGDLDLRRHYQIVGQTGTGKSTLLATTILSAIEQGYGLTFFDPHGNTIDVVLHSLPEKYADRVRVVRIGDADNPVPLNIWDSDDPEKEERNISDLCELFGDIFNPPGQDFVGPRYERWLSTFAKASIAFLGNRASLESITVISQSQNNMLKLSKKIIHKYPLLVETIKQEYGLDRSADFQNILNWYLCKFQRLTSVEQLRKTLGAGANALDFIHTIDSDKVTLIDLASPTIGTHAARIVGTLVLMKLWNAVLTRKERDRTHLVVVDEASLFQTNPVPKMLAESRKFGISMILCHQHTGQLSREIRDALEANSANFSAFRLSAKDAYDATTRFDDPAMRASLTRLDAFNAVTTLSVDGRQTAPFTLETIRPKREKNGDRIAAKIEAKSIETLVEPYRGLAALTPEQILDLLNEEKKVENTDEYKPEWLKKWEEKYQKQGKVS